MNTYSVEIYNRETQTIRHENVTARSFYAIDLTNVGPAERITAVSEAAR